MDLSARSDNPTALANGSKFILKIPFSLAVSVYKIVFG